MGNINKYNAYKKIAPSRDAAVEILNNKGLVLGEPAVVPYYTEDSSEGEKEVKLLFGVGSIGGKVEIIEGGSVSVPIDNYPEEDSSNLVSSGGVWQAIQDSSGMNVPIDDYPYEDSSNLVSSGGVWQAIQDALSEEDDSKYKEICFTITPLLNNEPNEISSYMVGMRTRVPMIISTSIDNGITWTDTNTEEYFDSSDDCYYPVWYIEDANNIQFKCNFPENYVGEYAFGEFYVDTYYELSGNIMSLLFGDKFKTETSLEGYGDVFNNMFRYTPVMYTNKLVLPALTIDICAYQNMFKDCSDLKTPPKRLPADNLPYGCYYGMFQGCLNLEYTPIIEATTMLRDNDSTNIEGSCCEYMFASCNKLTKINELMPETLSSSCYKKMFYGCESLIQVPENLLHSESIAPSCYQAMFQLCTLLTNSPNLPSTELEISCYEDMFEDCISLKKAPELPATTLVDSCYKGMFANCETLNEITCLATDIGAKDCTYNWVYGVSDFGTFTYAVGMKDWEIDSYDGIPYGWNAVEPGEDTPIMHSELPMIYFDYDFYYSKADGKFYPVNHPDLSTQPSLLSERFGKYQMFEVLLPIYPTNAADSIVPGDDYVVPYMFEDTNYLVFTDGIIIDSTKDIVEAHIIGKGVYDHATILKEDFETIEGKTIEAYKVYALFPIPENLKNLEYLYLKYYISDRSDYGYGY